MASKIQLRRDSSSNWRTTNPVLAEGEMGVELDTNRSKLGDGVSNWNDILYMTDTNAVGTYDAKYLIKTRNGDADQTIASRGTTTFDGLVEANRGVKVAGGNLDLMSDGWIKLSGNPPAGTTMAIGATGGGINLFGSSAIRVGDSRYKDDAGFLLTGNLSNSGGTTGFAIRNNVVIDGGINAYRGLEMGTSYENGETYDSIQHFRAQPNRNAAARINSQVGFLAGANLADTGTSPTTGVLEAYGFQSALSVSDADHKSWNFYAAGTAPNYFRGAITCSTDDDYGSSTLFTGTAGTSNTTQGVLIAQSGLYRVSRDATNTQPLFELQRLGDTTGFVITFGQAENKCGHIRTTNNGGIQIVSDDGVDPVLVVNSDARVKTLTPFSGSAADVVSQLNPGVNGFIAHELQAQVSDAVTGTQDATEAIGTLADYDGTVLETEVTEPDASELTYTEMVPDEHQTTAIDGEPKMVEVTRTKTWAETGTKPVYQGVDQTKLIPLLTKALQEALERIEQLESGGGSSDFESRIAALEVDMDRFKSI